MIQAYVFEKNVASSISRYLLYIKGFIYDLYRYSSAYQVARPEFSGISQKIPLLCLEPFLL